MKPKSPAGAGLAADMTQSSQKKKFILKGETIAYIDWANVHGWETSLKHEIDIEHLIAYLKTYPEIRDIRLYFGKDIYSPGHLGREIWGMKKGIFKVEIASLISL